MNQAEYDYCVVGFFVHAWECQQWAVISKVAEQVAKDECPGSRPNGRQDALRHCIWQACLTATVGLRFAFFFGFLHEQIRYNDPSEKRMDLWNNGIGQVIGLLSPRSGRVRAYVPPCQNALRRGILHRLAN